MRHGGADHCGAPTRSIRPMIPNRDDAYLVGLVGELRRLPSETEWVEFKTNRAEPQEIGEYLSALANGAALNGKNSGYLLWGIADGSHAIVGTRFVPGSAKQGNEPLENWLRRGLTPPRDFRFHEILLEGKRVVILELEPAKLQPVEFRGERFIRVGSVKKKLREHPEKERALWDIFSGVAFEDGIADERVSDAGVMDKIDYPEYFNRIGMPLPDGRAAILSSLSDGRLIAPCDAGGWNITNLGAILFARNLEAFRHIWRKTTRVIQYRGEGRTAAHREREFTAGYAIEFDSIVEHIMTLAPANEEIEGVFRREKPMFPRVAVRELVANALIHQDFSVTGAGPMIGLFDTRLEVSNPGEPLVDTLRFVDAEPKSRNERLVRLMRRFDFCEDRGSGIDRVVEEIERRQLPAPRFEVPPGSTRAVLFAHKDLSDMDRAERVRACYLHACLRYVHNQPMNNGSLRKRFDIPNDRADVASRLLREAVDDGMITVRDANVGTRNRTYLPFWAA